MEKHKEGYVSLTSVQENRPETEDTELTDILMVYKIIQLAHNNTLAYSTSTFHTYRYI